MFADSRIRLGLAALLGGALAVAGCHNLDLSSRRAKGEIAIYDDLFSLSVVDVNNVVAVGYHGAAYWTDDGGENWHKGQVPTNRLLYSVSMADKQHGWAVGQLGVILRTEDGGRTWRLQPNLKADENTHLFGVHALDVVELGLEQVVGDQRGVVQVDAGAGVTGAGNQFRADAADLEVVSGEVPLGEVHVRHGQHQVGAAVDLGFLECVLVEGRDGDRHVLEGLLLLLGRDDDLLQGAVGSDAGGGGGGRKISEDEDQDNGADEPASLHESTPAGGG